MDYIIQHTSWGYFLRASYVTGQLLGAGVPDISRLLQGHATASWIRIAFRSPTSITTVLESSLTLYDTMDCSPARLLRPWNSPGKNTGVGCHSLLQGNFLTQGSNPGLRHCRQILYCSSHQGNHLSQQRSHCGRKHRRYLRVTIRKSFLSACS